MRTDAHYLWDIIDAADAIDRFIAGKDLEKFVFDEVTRSAVHSKLIIMGEAVSQLSPALTEKHTSVPWDAVRRFRNLIIHGYFRIDWDIIWHTATGDARDLRHAATEILATNYPHFRAENS